MPKRTRLPKKSKAGADSRLRSAIRQELKMVSDARLTDYIGASKSALSVDPLLSAYHELAVREAERRKSVRKLYGAEPPELAPKGALVLAGTLEAPRQVAKRIADFYASVARGDLAEDVVFAVDYLGDKLSEFWHSKEKAEKRWLDFAKAHNIIRKTEGDYLAGGYTLKRRLPVDVQPATLRKSLQNYRKGYESVVIVPTRVNGKPKYSLFVKGVR